MTLSMKMTRVALVVALGAIISVQASDRGVVPTANEDTITLECDFSDSANRRQTMRYLWNIYNKIAPVESFEMISGPHEFVNIVRPLGGKVVKGTNTKMISDDTYKWDGKKYFYDWAPLKKQIDHVLEKAKIYQLLLDNPSWAFQRGLELEGKDATDVYGNPWAPDDPEAWATYIKAMLNELITTYGRERVGQWRYCVGREIGTPGHWRSGEKAFFDHYKNTEKAVREVLPEAKVGTHLLWASDPNSYGQNFIPWCKENGSRYDFMAISYYPKYRNKNRVDMEHVYSVDIAPLVELPEWNPDATFEIHEYALIKDMVNHRAVRAPALHRNVFKLMMAKMIYEKNLGDVFVWADAPVYTETLRLLKGLEGHAYYKSTKRGHPQKTGNMIDAIFSKDEAKRLYTVSAYNYNADSEEDNEEPLRLAATLPVPVGTGIKYRVGKYTSYHMSVKWSSWKTGTTREIAGGKNSVATFSEKIPAFSFLKYEITTDQ